jgi:hypothetical protein
MRFEELNSLKKVFNNGLKDIKRNYSQFTYIELIQHLVSDTLAPESNVMHEQINSFVLLHREIKRLEANGTDAECKFAFLAGVFTASLVFVVVVLLVLIAKNSLGI